MNNFIVILIPNFYLILYLELMEGILKIIHSKI